jgi:hypothetical protein
LYVPGLLSSSIGALCQLARPSETADSVAYTALSIIPRRLGETLFDIDHIESFENRRG